MKWNEHKEVAERPLQFLALPDFIMDLINTVLQGQYAQNVVKFLFGIGIWRKDGRNWNKEKDKDKDLRFWKQKGKAWNKKQNRGPDLNTNHKFLDTIC